MQRFKGLLSFLGVSFVVFSLSSLSHAHTCGDSVEENEVRTPLESGEDAGFRDSAGLDRAERGGSFEARTVETSGSGGRGFEESGSGSDSGGGNSPLF